MTTYNGQQFNWTANTASTYGVGYPQNVYVSQPYTTIAPQITTYPGGIVGIPVPEREEDVLTWLRRRVDEVTELAWAA
jgi:light-regulated signal transduction histidine kinase (bacteriophytochrome)